MFKPKYKISLTEKCFPKAKFVCLGSQLSSIISYIRDFLPKHTWYGADVDAIGKGATKHNVNNIQLNEIGSDLQFIDYCSEIEQFIWGVFLCINSNFSSQPIQSVELETEDEPFRSIPCDGVIFEIRTFDTSYFEIYSDDESLMKMLSTKYKVEIETITS